MLNNNWFVETDSNQVMPISISLSGLDNSVAHEPNSLIFELLFKLIIFNQDTSRKLIIKKLQFNENNLS